MREGSSEPDGSWRGLLRWLRPFLRPSSRALVWVGLGTAVILACQAIIPLRVEAVLGVGALDIFAMTVLVGLVVLQLVTAHRTFAAVTRIAVTTSHHIRLAAFDRTMHSTNMLRTDFGRPSIIDLHAPDANDVGEAVQMTLNHGIPGALRILVSLIFLYVVMWPAGIVMTIAVIAFLLARSHIGGQLRVADAKSFSMNGRVTATVDEALTASRAISGLHVFSWVEERFRVRAERLEESRHVQGQLASQLVTSAQTAGFLGLLVVVFYSVSTSEPNLAAAAAALLYIDGVVTPLSRLPFTIQAIELAVVHRWDFDRVLKMADSSSLEPSDLGALSVLQDRIVEPTGRLVGIVNSADIETDDALALMVVGGGLDGWRLAYDRNRLRRQGFFPEKLHVPADPLTLNASIADHFHAVAPESSETDMLELLEAAGIGHLVRADHGLTLPLGLLGSLLTVNERQRLAVATALAARPELLLVGPILALADTDSALPVIRAIQQHHAGRTIIAARTAEVAQVMDEMLFVTATDIHLDTHEQLLVSVPEYAHLWVQRLSSSDVDLSVLGISDAAQQMLLTRLVTERYLPGELIYREGAPADRIVFTVSGQIEILVGDASNQQRRVAVLGPGNHCGDLRLTAGEVRQESAKAINQVVVRTLSREAISAGMTGLLDRTPTERSVVTAILRDGPLTQEAILEAVRGFDEAEILSAIALLTRDSALSESEGRFSVVQKRGAKSGAADILDRLIGL